MYLWPENLLEDYDEMKAPSNILKTQGLLLGEKTGNLIEGKVQRSVNGPEDYDTLSHVFSIEAPTIMYSYDLMNISYGIPFYPVEIEFEEEKMMCDSEEDFISLLKQIFSSSKTRRIIQALLSQLEYRQTKRTDLD